MVNVMEYAIIVGLLFIVGVLIYVIFGVLIPTIENLETELEDTNTEWIEMRRRISNALTIMRNADIRGSFEADDEVGGAFRELKQTIEILNELI